MESALPKQGCLPKFSFRFLSQVRMWLPSSAEEGNEFHFSKCNLEEWKKGEVETKYQKTTPPRTVRAGLRPC